MFNTIKQREKDFNNWLLDWIIGGSYLGEGRKKFFARLKNISLEAYAHILIQWDKIKERYRN